MLNNFEHAGFAVRRVDRTIARSIASTAIFIVFLQAIPHALSHSANVQQPWLWLGVALVGGLQLTQVVAAWLGRSLVPFYLALYLSILLLVVTWPLTLAKPLSPGEMPWLWWLLAIGGMNAFGAFKAVWAFIASCTLSAAWLILSQTPAYGPRPLGIAIQDTLLAFFFSTLLGMLLIALREGTAKTDEQMSRQAVLAAEVASVRALETERSRVNALVHDSVLTALVLGANAESAEDRAAAAQAAEAALVRLGDDSAPAQSTWITSSALFESISQEAGALAPDLQIHIDHPVAIQVGADVAEALAEATIQAVTNSVRHAGTVRHRELRMSSTGERLKIVIKDDGRGFRESRVSKSRLGVRLSIRGRVTDAGGRVAIQSQPGLGCTVAITWPAREHEGGAGA